MSSFVTRATVNNADPGLQVINFTVLTQFIKAMA